MAADQDGAHTEASRTVKIFLSLLVHYLFVLAHETMERGLRKIKYIGNILLNYKPQPKRELSLLIT